MQARAHCPPVLLFLADTQVLLPLQTGSQHGVLSAAGLPRPVLQQHAQKLGTSFGQASHVQGTLTAESSYEQQQLCWEHPEQHHEYGQPQQLAVEGMLDPQPCYSATLPPQHQTSVNAACLPPMPASLDVPTAQVCSVQQVAKGEIGLPSAQAAQMQGQASSQLPAPLTQPSGLPVAASLHASSSNRAADLSSQSVVAPLAHHIDALQTREGIQDKVTDRDTKKTQQKAWLQPQQQQQQQQDRQMIGAGEQTALDTLYATVFPYRQVTQVSSGELHSRLQRLLPRLHNCTCCLC